LRSISRGAQSANADNIGSRTRFDKRVVVVGTFDTPELRYVRSCVERAPSPIFVQIMNVNLFGDKRRQNSQKYEDVHRALQYSVGIVVFEICAHVRD
jgi:uncharacterized protein (UPF0261 family)